MRATVLALCWLTMGIGIARAETTGEPAPKPYLDSAALDLTRLLPPPPLADSAETKSELGDLLVVQVTRTPEMVARAQADAIEEVWRFADVLGPRFVPDTLPKTTALFERLVATDMAVVDPAKASFGRSRPSMVSDLVRPVVKPSTSGSWPSAHAALGTLMGLVLSEMLPEKRTTLMERARVYAENRIVAGAHFPSDVAMGRVSGTVIAAALFKDSAFATDYAAAKAELRTVLGVE